ncbi:MAG: DUF4203 domain-containing protein [Phycisphaeraceae bacterium]|nr:DUF4203 domain-containing protein [Phycisphaeraceae bacterium]
MTLHPLVTLAQAASNGNNLNGSPFEVLTAQFRKGMDVLMRPEDLADTLTSINIVWAGVMIVLGCICTFQGYKWRKTVVLILAALCGMWAGSALGSELGSGAMIAALALAMLFAIIALPLMKFTVAFFGGLAGAFLGANLWSMLAPPDQQSSVQLGAVIGLIAVGMLAFIAFRIVVIVFTSIVGSTMLVLGLLSLFVGLGVWQGDLGHTMSQNRLIVPLVVAVIGLIGGVIQQGGGLIKLIEQADNAEKKPGTAAKPAKA